MPNLVQSSFTEFIIKEMPFLKDTFWHVLNFCKMYFIWLSLHYCVSVLYNYLCVPKTIIGFIIYPLSFHSPQCKILLWSFNLTSNSVNHFAATCVTWFLSNMSGGGHGDFKNNKT